MDESRHVFVTGASGFVGGHLVESLSREHQVRALSRSDKSARQVADYGATPVRGELGAVSAAELRGVDTVIHAAAFVEEWGTREQFWKTNVEGTAQLLQAAREAGVRRFVHVGTEAAVFDGRDLVGIDETYPYPSRHKYLYSETKAEAEKRVLAGNDATLETLSVRPRLVWGPRDASVLPTILRKAKVGQFAWIDGGKQRTSTTHVANLVHALTLAMHKGKAGEAYFVADEGERTLRQFFTALAATQGVSLGKTSLPSAVMGPAARAVEGIWRAFGLTKTPPLTTFAIDMFAATVTVDTQKAQRELGYTPVITVAEGLAGMAGAPMDEAHTEPR